ncbi:MAG: hypothetical protein QRY16_06660 [Enterobacterales bacterium endosymbiont of Blomia tropicalis]|nr:hypothetical protein [Mixta mediterraneensis]MDL4913480.1 hypothetical protein [Mixta mediterraneensis]
MVQRIPALPALVSEAGLASRSVTVSRQRPLPGGYSPYHTASVR